MKINLSQNFRIFSITLFSLFIFDLIGVLFSQVNSTIDWVELGSEMHNEFQKELFRQLNKR